ncbi:MAG: hypothetical protein AAGA02_10185 [Bacteroidota bacterium]
MKRIPILLLFLFFIWQGCNRNKYITVKHVKPVNYNRPYNRKKDKRKKRTKYVKMKILKQSKEVKPAKVKKPKPKKVKEEVEEGDLEEVINEPDSTGLFR